MRLTIVWQPWAHCYIIHCCCPKGWVPIPVSARLRKSELGWRGVLYPRPVWFLWSEWVDHPVLWLFFLFSSTLCWDGCFLDSRILISVIGNEQILHLGKLKIPRVGRDSRLVAGKEVATCKACSRTRSPVTYCLREPSLLFSRSVWLFYNLRLHSGCLITVVCYLITVVCYLGPACVLSQWCAIPALRVSHHNGVLSQHCGLLSHHCGLLFCSCDWLIYRFPHPLYQNLLQIEFILPRTPASRQTWTWYSLCPHQPSHPTQKQLGFRS